MSDLVLASLHVYPLKTVQGHAPREALVEPWGLAHDRRWTLADEAGQIVTQRTWPQLARVSAELLPGGGLRVTAPGHAALTVTVPEGGSTVAARHFRDGAELVPADPSAHAWFSAYLGAKVRLLYMDDPATRRPIDPRYALPGETVSLADGYPLLLTTVPSLEALNSLIAEGDHAGEGPLPMNRFRPNVVIQGDTPWAEDGWRRLTIGEVTFRVAKPCGRCVVTTIDQEKAGRGFEPPRTLARHRRFGDQLVFGQNLVPEDTGTLRVGDPVTILEQVPPRLPGARSAA